MAKKALPKEFDPWTRMALHLGWHGVYQNHAEEFIAAAKKVERLYYKPGVKHMKAMKDSIQVAERIAKAYSISLAPGNLVRIVSTGCFNPNVTVEGV